jgi:hypothetical protein
MKIFAVLSVVAASKGHGAGFVYSDNLVAHWYMETVPASATLPPSAL